MTQPVTSRWESAADKITSAIPYVAALAILVPCSYFIWFIYNGQSLSTSTADWGTFGDFVGGTLNPAVAFFALLLLLISVGIQREELKATRKELAEAASAQKATALHHETMKGIEDCRIFIELMVGDIDRELSKKVDYNIDDQDKSLFKTSGGPYSMPLEKLMFSVLETNHADLNNQFILTFKKTLNATAVRLTACQDALVRWKELHGQELCFAVEYYKRDLAAIANALKYLGMLKGEQHSFFMN